MKDVLQRYSKLIWFWTIINAFALFVNVFKIDVNFDTTIDSIDGEGTPWESQTSKSTIYLFTYGDSNSDESRSSFWPFVSYIRTYEDPLNFAHRTRYFSFHGIFYHYDFSEFVFYMSVLLSILLYKSYIVKRK